MRQRINPLLALVLVAIVVFVLFKLASWLFQILSVVAPLLFILALIIKREVVFGYVRWIWNHLKENTLMGILFSVLTVIGFPFVSLFLFVRAVNYNKWPSPREESSDGYPTEEADFEILEEDLLILEDRPEPIHKDRSS